MVLCNLLLAATVSASPLVVRDAATVGVAEARKIIADIVSGRPALIVGGPFLSRRAVDWNGESISVSDARARLSMLAATSVRIGGARGFDLGAFKLATGWETVRGGTIALDPDGKSLCIRSGGKLRQWDIQYAQMNPYAEGDDLIVLEARSDYAEAQIQFELCDAVGGRWFATVPLDLEWRKIVLLPSDFARHGKSALDPRKIVRIGLGVSEQYSPKMSGRLSSFHVRSLGSAKCPVPECNLSFLPFETFPAVEGVWPEYKTYVKDGRICYLDRPTGEGFGRGNIWRMKRLANASEAILLERRRNRPERCVALFGYRTAAELSEPGVRSRMDRALEAIGSGALLFEAGTDRFSYDPGETATVGASWRGRPKTLSIEIADAKGTRLERREFKADELGAGRVSFVWKPAASPAKYHVRAVLDGDDSIEHDFAVARTEPDPKEEFISVKGSDFMLKGRPWYPVSINFWPNYSGGTERDDYWGRWLVDGWYSPNLVRKDILNFVACGGNAVSIQNPAPGNERNVRDFYRICRECGVRVSQFVNWADPLAFNDTLRTNLETFLKLSGAAGDSTVYAYDTIWEPGNHTFRKDRREALDWAWQAWTVSQYGSVERAERCWGVSCGKDAKGLLRSPPDEAFAGKADAKWRKAMAAYRRFMDNHTARRWNALKRTLRAFAPNQLQSFRQGNTLPHDFALNGPVRHLDFVMPEGYQFGNTDAGENAIGWVTRYIDAYSAGKPIVWSEFGRNAWSSATRTTSADVLRDCAVYSERFYRAGLRGGANGFSPWWFPGGYRSDERSDYGIMGPDDLPRPPLETLRRYAPAIKTPRTRPAPTVWMDFDRDANGGGYFDAAFNAGREAFASAVAAGATLGVRIAGVGMTSADCPAMGLGDVPLEGRMPVKYLDADFDVLECRQESPTLLKVRAQLGNPGPADWKAAAAGTGGVNLVVFDADGGETIRTVPLASDVPRFGESAILTFDVPLAPSVRKVAFMLEAAGRFRFGERREVSVSASEKFSFASAAGTFTVASKSGGSCTVKGDRARFAGLKPTENGRAVLEMGIPIAWGDGGSWQVDGTKGKFPFLKQKDPRMYNQDGRRVAFTDPQGRRIGLEFPQGACVLIQDCREWDWATFMLRVRLPKGMDSCEVRYVTDDTVRRKGFTLDRFGQVRRNFPGKISSEAELKRDVEEEKGYYAALDFPGKLAKEGLRLNRYGGVAGSGAELGLRRTGFFHVERKGEKWHLVDPSGDDFFQLGICAFGGGDDFTYTEGREDEFEDLPPPGGAFDAARIGKADDWWHARAFSHYRANLIRKFGTCEKTATSLRNIDRVRQAGFNSMGAFTSEREAGRAKDFPYVGSVPLKGVKATPKIRGLFDPFDPQSVSAVERNFAGLAACADDPLVIGYFIGNEDAYEDVAREVPALDGSWAAKRELVKFLRERHGDVAAFNRAWGTSAKDFAAVEREPLKVVTAEAFADAAAFAERFLEAFFGLIESRFRKVDPNHLLIGCRWQMRTANDETLCRVAGRHLDVISLNYYTWGIDEKLVRRIYGWSGGKPQIWSEFFFSAAAEANPGPFSRDLATQRERGLAYRNYVEGAAALGFVVGTQWFSLNDQSATGRFFQYRNGESFNNGILSVTDRPYRDLLDGMLAAHLAVYPIRRGRRAPYRFADPRFTGEGKSTRLYAAGRTVAKGRADGLQDEYPLRPAELIPASRMVAGGNESTVEADFKAAWDDDNLYVHVNVKDATPMCNRFKGEGIWEGDVVEVFVGSEAVGEEGALKFSDRQFEFSAAPGGATYAPRMAAQPKIPVHVGRTAGGYALEAAIPWTAIGCVPKAGQTLIFDVGVGEAGPTGRRQTHIVWNGTEENCGDRTDWGRLLLQP